MDGLDLMYTTAVSNKTDFLRICDPAHLPPYLATQDFASSVAMENGIAFPVGPQLGAYSYLLSQEGLRKVHRLFTGPRNPVDVQLGEMNPWINTYMLQKALVAHTYDGTSDSQII